MFVTISMQETWRPEIENLVFHFTSASLASRIFPAMETFSTGHVIMVLLAGSIVISC